MEFRSKFLLFFIFEESPCDRLRSIGPMVSYVAFCSIPKLLFFLQISATFHLAFFAITSILLEFRSQSPLFFIFEESSCNRLSSIGTMVPFVVFCSIPKLFFLQISPTFYLTFFCHNFDSPGL